MPKQKLVKPAPPIAPSWAPVKLNSAAQVAEEASADAESDAGGEDGGETSGEEPLGVGYCRWFDVCHGIWCPPGLAVLMEDGKGGGGKNQVAAG